MQRFAAKLGEDKGEKMVKFMLTLVRHGETAYNKEGIIQGQMDIPLSDEGLKQADLLGKYLRNDIFTGIYASDLKRAYQTAEAVVKHSATTRPAIIPDVRLRERNFGELEGQPSQALKEYKREAKCKEQSSGNKSPSPMSYTPPGAETLFEVQDRAIQFFEDLCQQLKNSVELNSEQQPKKTRRMPPPGGEKSPTGSCTSESSLEPLGVDISTPDSVGPGGGSTHLCRDGSQSDSGHASPESPVEYNPEKAFNVAATLEVKSSRGSGEGGAVVAKESKKSPTSQRIKEAISTWGGRKTATKQGKVKSGAESATLTDQAGVNVVLAKELETQTRLEGGGQMMVGDPGNSNSHPSGVVGAQDNATESSANILVAAHGAWIRELMRHFVNNLQCCVPGGKHMATNRMSYNTGMSKFLVDLTNGIPHIQCIYLHKKEHLGRDVHLRESP